MSITEQPPADADVHLEGTQADWIDALGPTADTSGLEIGGDGRLASVLLGGIGADARAAARVA